MTDNFSSVAAIVSAVALVLAAAISAIALNRALMYLRNAHPVVWQQIGAPSMWRGRTGTTTPDSKFIALRQYRDIPDPELWRLCNRARLTSNLLAIVFAVFVLSFLYLVIKS